MNQSTFCIDQKISSLIPALREEEFEQLKESILEEGCRDPLTVWLEKSVLLDGHNRFKICQAHGLPFETLLKSFPDDESAMDWMDRNQLGRRNLTPEQMSLLRGRRYNRLKKADGQRGAQKLDHNEPASTAELISRQHGVSPATIKRDGQFANDIEKLKEIVPDVEQRITSKDRSEQPTKAEIQIAANLVETHPAAAAAILTKANHRALGTGENEWYTPSEYIAKAVAVMGEINLDPASSPRAQERVKAGKFFGVVDDGLAQEWSGRVWLNPPYSQPDIMNFVQKMVSEFQSGRVQEAIMLTHNYTDTAWFHLAESACSAICFTRGRIKFIGSDGSIASPTQGQAFFYYGARESKFRDIFKEVGFVR